MSRLTEALSAGAAAITAQWNMHPADAARMLALALPAMGRALAQPTAAPSIEDTAMDPRICAALDYLHPHLDAGTFAAPDWAIELALILTGTPPAAPSTPV